MKACGSLRHFLMLACALLAPVLMLAAGPAQAASWGAAPDFSALVKAYGPAVVNIGVARPALARPPQSPQSPQQPAQPQQPQPARPGVPAGPRDNIDEHSLGSGFIVSNDGYILTNAHVVERGTEISVKLTDRREFIAKLIGLDPVADVALLKIDADRLPTVKIGDPAKTQVGEWALAIGSPFGFTNSVTAGIVSAKGRVLPGAEYMPFLQTDVPVNPGNSGGPLFNLKGEVIGINSRIYSNSGGYEGLSFAIPIDVAMRIKAQLQAKGTVTRGRIGVVVQEVNQALADSFGLPRPAGALVSYVAPGGAADRAGLKPGDVIVKVGPREVVQSADALFYLADLTPEDKSTLTVWRDREPLALPITVDSFETPATTAPTQTGSAPLGIVLRPLLPQERQILRIDAGLLVERVNDAASRAGVKAGDLILSINGQPVSSIEALSAEVHLADGAVALLIQRGSARLFIPIEVPKPVAHEGG
jgi:serine protease Do